MGDNVLKQFTLTHGDAAIMIAPSICIDYHTYPKLETKLSRLIRNETRVSFDLSNMDYIDSAGVGFLLRVRNLAEMRGGRFEILNTSLRLRRIFRKLQLISILNIHKKPEESQGFETGSAHAVA